MSISYTKRGWTNNSPPAINAANLGAMDDGLKNAVDALNNMGDAGQQAVKEIGEAPATTTGGKLVNKITEAGYSLAPATGTSNLDNIADGTNYKRILAAPATALNAGTYDAAACTAFGIGNVAESINGVDANSVFKGGKYSVWLYTTGSLHYPHAQGTDAVGVLDVIAYSASNVLQVFTYVQGTGYVGKRYFRVSTDGVFGSWYQLWDAFSDGNGGQPPIGKGKWLDGAASNVNTWTDFITLPNVWAKYLFLAREPGGYYTYFVSAILSVSNGAIAMINYDCANTTHLQIRVGSGLTLQVYQNAGDGGVMQYALIPLTA